MGATAQLRAKARRWRQWAAIALWLPVVASAADPSLSARRADFDELWRTVNGQYVFLDGKQLWWNTLRERYADRVAQATTADAWSAVIEDALDELHDFHIGSNPGSAQVSLAVPTSADLWAVEDGADARVTAVRPGTDAQRARIRAGDRIIRIDGQPVATAIANRLGPAVDATQPAAREWALLTLVAGRRGVARTLELRAAEGGERTVTLPATRRFDGPAMPLSWSRLPDDIGVIRINNSLGEQATVGAFDAALAQLRDTRGLILDLRECPSGGNSGVALGILGRFVDMRRPYQRHRIPRYGQADVERNWLEEVAPRGPFTYRAPVVVLVGHWTGSMGEGMAVGLDGMRRATVVGSTMAQLAGATETFTLARTGARVALPTEELFHVDGTPRHRWVPPVVIAPGASLSDADAGLEHARGVLRGASTVR
ncbi:MAG: S41 family peptidase [Betaproteobacteria bacterium]